MLDAIILGQGVVGSLLAMQLLEQGKRVVVLDNAHLSASSLIAAGMMNPVSGTRLVKLWETDEDRDFVIGRYQALEKTLGVSFLREHRLVRLLSSELELESFKKRQEDASYAADCQPLDSLSEVTAVCDPGVAQYQSGLVYQIRAPLLLRAVQDYLSKRDAYRRIEFDYDDLEVSETSVTWKDLTANCMVFCEGAKAVDNPYFRELDWKTSIGDVVELTCDALPKNTILNHGKWLCPTSDGWYKYGSSAYWEDSVAQQSTSVRQLKNKLQKFLKVPYQVKSVTHGVRPTFRNRKPIAMFHDRYPSLALVNGMGGTGMSKAPLVIDRFVKQLTGAN